MGTRDDPGLGSAAARRVRDVAIDAATTSLDLATAFARLLSVTTAAMVVTDALVLVERELQVAPADDELVGARRILQLALETRLFS
jgi:hypothetical protein